MKKVFCLGFAGILLTGCVSAKTSSFRDPLYQNKVFAHVCAYAALGDFKQRREAEERFKQRFPGRDIKVSSDFLPPTRDYRGEEITTIMKDLGCDCALVIYRGERSREILYFQGENGMSPVASSRHQFIGEIYDLENNKKAWISTSTVDYKTSPLIERDSAAVDAFVDSLGAKLLEDQIIFP